MHLLSLNLQKSSAIVTAVYGNFSGPKNQEIVTARGSIIELLRPDDTGKIIVICETPVFAVVRSLLPFRLAGSNIDYLVVGSDAGKISILEYDNEKNDWKSIHCEVFGKTGCRRIVPGQYLAADPKGRAIMIGAIEKQRFVYIMNRDSANRLTISSPLEAHKTETILFSMVGVDVGFDNPIFAMIELEYKECDEDPTGEAIHETEKKLTFYELDLGLNHVVRKWSEPISRTANLLLAVPGGDDGPSGVLICGENWVSYKNQNHPEIRTALPRRVDMPMQRGLLITTATVHKQRGLYFFMLQSELGDLYKVTLVHDENNRKMVVDVVVTVFDSIACASALCITKTGMMFVAAEFGNHYLLQFQKMGDDDTAIVAHSVSDDTINEELGDDSISASRVALAFQPSLKLQNLAVTDEIESLACITDMTIEDLAKEGTPQIYTLCGRGNRSTLRVLRHGISVTEMAISELPGRPNAVWTVKEEVENENDKYIIVSFNNATLVLSIGENVEEVTDTGFLASVPTIEVVLLADNALLQVHATGIRHIRRDPNGGAEKRISEWKTPGKKQIEKASANSRQVAISLAGGEITYFEIDQAGQLVEMKTIDLGKEVSCLDIGEVPIGRARSSFLAVGDWEDRVQVLSLEPNDLLVTRSTMVVPSRPESVCLVTMDTETTIQHQETLTPGTTSRTLATAPSAIATTMYLNIGLVSGVLHRVAVDTTAGTLSDSRQRFLGIKPVKLFRVLVHGRRGLLALSTRAWLLYNYQGRYLQAPLSYETLEYASNFISEVCSEGIVAIAANTLRIITVDNLGAMFNQTIHPLRYTPRKLCQLPNTNYLAIIETDHNEYTELEKEELSRSLKISASALTPHVGVSASVGASASGGDEDMELESNGTSKVMNGNHEQESGAAEEGEEDEDEIRIPVRSTIPPMEGHWASCLRIMDPVSGNVLELIELSENEAAFSITTCTFSHISEETFLLIGTAQNMTLHPRRLAMGYIHVYRILGERLQLLHKTAVDDVPLAMCEFQGRLLVGVGKSLRLYELGKKKLLKKCENKTFPTGIVKLHVNADRIYASDLSESVHFVKFRRQDNSFVIFADETSPRFITSSVVLDYDTIAAADKFGNIFVLQLPLKANDDVVNPVGSRLLWDQGLLNGAPTKARLLTHYHLGEAITSMNKCALVPGGEQAIIVGTVMGGIFAFLPFRRKEDVDFYQHLEMYMRQEWPSLIQRDHLSYRSYFQPVKDTVDGDLCEQYGRMPLMKQKEIADDLNRTPTEMMKKLEEIRNSLL